MRHKLIPTLVIILILVFVLTMALTVVNADDGDDDVPPPEDPVPSCLQAPADLYYSTSGVFCGHSCD